MQLPPAICRKTATVVRAGVDLPLIAGDSSDTFFHFIQAGHGKITGIGAENISQQHDRPLAGQVSAVRQHSQVC